MNLQAFLDRARKSIGDFCANECKAYCCRKGYLVINKKQKELLLKDNLPLFQRKALIKQIGDDKWSLFLGDASHPCPALKDNKCLLHHHPLRPKACKDFPIFQHDNTIIFSERCLAVKQMLFYSVEAKLLSLGYKIKRSRDADGLQGYAVTALMTEQIKD
jgi:Fe-S-cluster containining protein